MNTQKKKKQKKLININCIDIINLRTEVKQLSCVAIFAHTR